MTGTHARQPSPSRPRSDNEAVRYLLTLKPGEDLTGDDLAELARLDGPPGPEEDDSDGAGFGPDTSPPEGWELMTDAERQQLLEPDPPPAAPEVLDAGFTHRDGGPGQGLPQAERWTRWRRARRWRCSPTEPGRTASGS
jgi:hypothetical protein